MASKTRNRTKPKPRKAETFYITTAIPYVNAKPHIGHVLEFVQTDVIKRYQSGLYKETFLTTGADENSLKNVQAAEKLGISTQRLCDENGRKFKELADKIGLSYNEFKKSSSKTDHWPGVQKLWELCNKSGDIYKKKYKGIYCVGCEAFYKEDELSDGLCKEHNSKPVEVEEENYFFKLSRYQRKLEQLIENDELKIYPETRKNEVLSFIRAGLEDFSISRSVARARNWGVPVPGDETQIMYVWFDALSCYITGVGYGFDEKKFKKWWPCDLHVIGKGIIRFHAIYWIAMLLSAGLKLPKGIFVHGYITVEGQKMSKSLGNVLDPMVLIEKYGADQLRYYLMAEVPTFDDGDFSESKLVERINNELVANLGNLVNRTLVFIKNNFDSKIEMENEKGEFTEEDEKFLEGQEKINKEVEADLKKYELTSALHRIMAYSKNANKYFQDNKPWELVKTDMERATTVICLLARQVYLIADMIEPYMPNTTKRIREMLTIFPVELIGEPQILFNKIDVKQIEKLKQQAAKPVQIEMKFADLDLEVGQILEAKKHPDADKLFIEKIKLGDKEIQVVSGLAKDYTPEEIVGKTVVIVKNLEPAVIRNAKSEGMVLGVEDKETKYELFSPDVPVGTKIKVEGEHGQPKEKISFKEFSKVKMEVKEGKAYYNGKPLTANGKKIESYKIKEGNVR
ncbi:MAG: methionine--tRNA ligase [Candidatus Micrarchaeota archaeon]